MRQPLPTVSVALVTSGAPTVSVTAGAASEASATTGFTVTVSGGTERVVQVNYATADGRAR